MKKEKGSLTLEAILAFTVFISTMFLLLTIVKLVLFMIVFDNVTAETAKTLATGAYPISYINAFQEGLEAKVEYTKAETLEESLVNTGKQSLLAGIMGGSLITGVATGKAGLTALIKDTITGILVENLKEEVYAAKEWSVRWAGGQIVQRAMDASGINYSPEKLTLRHIKVPQTEMEYDTVYGKTSIQDLLDDGKISLLDDERWKHIFTNLGGSASTGTEGMSAPGNHGNGFNGNSAVEGGEDVPGSDNGGFKSGWELEPASAHNATDGHFNAGDVVVCLEYDYTLALPFLPSFEITLRSTAIEKAWINGTATGPKRTEGINLEGVLFGGNKVVYVPVGVFGKTYHTLSNCESLWTGYTTVTEEYAQSQKMVKCETCLNGGKVKTDEDKKKDDEKKTEDNTTEKEDTK